MSGSELISVLQTGFYICLAISIMFFVITIIFFFVFNIPLIFNIKTGRAKKRTIEEMKKANSETGRLRSNGRTLTSKLDGRNVRNMPYNGVQQMPETPQQGYNVTSYDGSEVTGSLNSKNKVDYNVSYVNQPQASSQQPPVMNEVFAETSLLALDAEETSLLSPDNSGFSQGQAFRIIEEIKFIHTSEVIS